MLNSAKLSQLTAQVADLEAKLATATTDKGQLEADLAQAKTDLATAQAKALDMEGQVNAANAAKTAAEASLADAVARANAAEAKATAAEAAIDTKVNERLAAAGVDPLKLEAKKGGETAPDASAKPMARATSAMAASFFPEGK